MQGRIIIIGAGGHATSVADLAFSAGWQIACFIDATRAGGSLLGIPILKVPDTVRDAEAFCVAIGDNDVRERMSAEILMRFRDAQFPVLVHSFSYVSPYSSLGSGTVVLAGASIGSNATVGKGCIVNTGASIGHDVKIEDFASIGPGATTGGRARIGQRAVVALGAKVRHGVSLGNDAILGAAAYLHCDLPSNAVAVGVPAKVVRMRRRGEVYL